MTTTTTAAPDEILPAVVTYGVTYFDPATRRLLESSFVGSEEEAIGNALRFAQGLLDEGHVSVIRQRFWDGPITII